MRWRTRPIASALALACALAQTPAAGPPPPSTLLAQLTAIDVGPSAALLEFAGGPGAGAEVLALATPGGDVGVRIRALRALAVFPSQAGLGALRQAIGAAQLAERGADLVVLVAAIEALGVLADPADVPALADLVAFPPSRDVRAAAARALEQIGDPAAIDALRAQLAAEPTAQVRLAITDALRALE